MKNINEIISQAPVFINDWTHEVDVISDFEGIYLTNKEYTAAESPYPNTVAWLERKERMNEAIDNYKDVKMLFASYGNANYSGDGWVLFEKDGELFEVHGGHCSCYGLEDQWEPEVILSEELENRLLNGTFGEDNWSDNNFKEDLCEFLGVEFKKNRL